MGLYAQLRLTNKPQPPRDPVPLSFLMKSNVTGMFNVLESMVSFRLVSLSERISKLCLLMSCDISVVFPSPINPPCMLQWPTVRLCVFSIR